MPIFKMTKFVKCEWKTKMLFLHSKIHVRTSKIKKILTPMWDEDTPSCTLPQHGLWACMGRCATDRPCTTLSPYVPKRITSQRGSAWHCYIGHMLSIGKMRFSISRPGKTNEYFVTKLGRRDYVGEIYKLTKFDAYRLRNGASTCWWNITVLGLSSPTFFSVSLASPHVAILVRIARLMAQKSCSDWYTCLLEVWCLQIYYEGVHGPKNRQILTRKSVSLPISCKKSL